MAKYTVNMADQLLKVREKVQEKLKKEAEVVVEIEQPSALQSATADYLSKKEKPHPLSSPKNLNEEQLDEFKKASVEFDRRNKSDMMKAKKDLEKKGHKVDVSGSMITVTAKRGSDIGREIKDVMNFYNGAKRAKALESVEEETLDEGRMKELAMKIAQVYSNMKKDKNMRSFADKFRKDVAKSLDIRKSLEKVLPDYVAGKDITNIMSKHVPGHKEENKVEEKLDKEDEPKVKEVIKKLKGASKAHAGQAQDLEKAVNEWFKEKNIDVKVRQLDESTQVYVPIGRRIPNEIREELITTQYGKMPEDVKNVEDINYGNFVENSITMNNDFWSKVLHGTKGE